MASQPLAFGELLAGGILLTAALTGSSVTEVVTGKAGPLKGFDLPGIGGTATAATPDAGKVNPSNDASWGGSKAVADIAAKVAKTFSAPIVSEKRPTRNTASGGVSDHWEGSLESYAYDIGATANAAGDTLARAIYAAFGLPYSAGQWATTNIKHNGSTYRVQIGWRVPGHFDHIHVGAKKIG